MPKVVREPPRLYTFLVAKRIQYKTYAIKSAPTQVLSSGKWEVHISILWELGGIVSMRSFSAVGLYDTEEEADLHGLAYGQRIIDGKVPGETVG